VGSLLWLTGRRLKAAERLHNHSTAASPPSNPRLQSPTRSTLLLRVSFRKLRKQAADPIQRPPLPNLNTLTHPLHPPLFPCVSLPPYRPLPLCPPLRPPPSGASPRPS